MMMTIVTLMAALTVLRQGGNYSGNAKGHNECNKNAHVQVSSVERNRSYFITESASSLLGSRHAATEMVNEILILR